MAIIRKKNNNLDSMTVLFGGSFDPPHVGHLSCVRSVLRDHPLWSVVILPAYAPFATTSLQTNQDQKKLHASFEDRLFMAQLAFKDEPRTVVSGIEESLKNNAGGVRSLSVLKLMRSLKDPFNEASMVFLMGDDQWETFANWYEPVAILEHTSLMIIPRKKVFDSSKCETQLDVFCKTFGLRYQKVDSQKNNEKVYGLFQNDKYLNDIYFKDEPLNEASSSDLKTSSHLSNTLKDKWLSKEVKAYIKQKDLYKGLFDNE